MRDFEVDTHRSKKHNNGFTEIVMVALNCYYTECSMKCVFSVSVEYNYILECVHTAVVVSSIDNDVKDILN